MFDKITFDSFLCISDIHNYIFFFLRLSTRSWFLYIFGSGCCFLGRRSITSFLFFFGSFSFLFFFFFRLLWLFRFLFLCNFRFLNFFRFFFRITFSITFFRTSNSFLCCFSTFWFWFNINIMS